MRVLGLVPARGQSVGVPRKHTRALGGMPLLEYTARAALAACELARVVLSTDDEDIAALGRRCGLEVPFLRPAELARHDTPMLAVVEHALHWADATGERFEAVCLLQPTTPLRSAAVIDRCVALLREGVADTVMTVLPVPSAHHPDWVYFADAAGALQLSTGGREPPPRRQALRPAWHREGSVYVVRREVVLEQHSLYGATVRGVPLDPDRSVNIDEPADWARAESLVRALATTMEGAS